MHLQSSFLPAQEWGEGPWGQEGSHWRQLPLAEPHRAKGAQKRSCSSSPPRGQQGTAALHSEPKRNSLSWFFPGHTIFSLSHIERKRGVQRRPSSFGTAPPRDLGWFFIWVDYVYIGNLSLNNQILSIQNVLNDMQRKPKHQRLFYLPGLKRNGFPSSSIWFHQRRPTISLPVQHSSES